MKIKNYISKLLWFHKRFWGRQYVIVDTNNKRHILIYHKTIYLLDKNGGLLGSK